MFNYFKKFIDGLKNSRFVNQDAPEAKPEKVPEGTVEAEAATKSEASDQAVDDLTKTIYQSESMRRAKEYEGEELGEKPVVLSKKDKDRFKEHAADSITGKLRPMGVEQKPKEVAAEPEKDVILDRAKTLASEEEAEAELAALGVTKKPKRPEEPLTPKARLAMAAKAASEGTKGELAYIKEHLLDADEDGLKDWTAYISRVSDAIANAEKGATIDAVVTQVMENIGKQEDLSTREKAMQEDIRWLGAVAKMADVKPGEGTHKEVAQKMLDNIMAYKLPSDKKDVLKKQFEMTFG